MNMKKALAGLALTGALSSVAGTAVAATQYPVQGGQWNYGFNGVGIYSDYFHGSQCHGSSVWNDWGNNRSADIAPGRWSNSWHRATPWTNNKYFYRVC